MQKANSCGCVWDGPIQVLTCGDHNVAAKNLNRAQAQFTRLELENDKLKKDLETANFQLGEAVALLRESRRYPGVEWMIKTDNFLSKTEKRVGPFGGAVSREEMHERDKPTDTDKPKCAHDWKDVALVSQRTMYECAKCRVTKIGDVEKRQQGPQNCEHLWSGGVMQCAHCGAVEKRFTTGT